MKKEHRVALTEWTTRLPDDELRWIGIRLVERLAGDVALVLQHLETRPEVHEVMMAAGSAEEVFGNVSVIQDLVCKEAKRRGVLLSNRPLVPVYD